MAQGQRGLLSMECVVDAGEGTLRHDQLGLERGKALLATDFIAKALGHQCGIEALTLRLQCLFFRSDRASLLSHLLTKPLRLELLDAAVGFLKGGLKGQQALVRLSALAAKGARGII